MKSPAAGMKVRSVPATIPGADSGRVTRRNAWVDDAFWQDVLDARYAGPTEAYSQINGAFGVKWGGDKLITSIKVINLLNEDIQSHVFGDIMKRQVIGEVRVTF